MRVHNPIGSKQRLVEIFQKVNKVKLNEDFNSTNNDAIVIDVLEKIKNGTITIKNRETQASDNATFVVLMGTDANNGIAKLTFKVDTQEGDQEGVETVGNVELKEFSFRSADGQQTYDLNEDDLREFNQQHGQELYDIIEDDIDVESTTGDELADELQEAITLIDAIKIDSSPYGGGFDKMQTGKNYADNKPTNDAVRVKSPELEQFIQEDLAPVVNKISTPEELTAYVQQLKAQGIKGLRAEDCPKLAGQALYNVAVRMADKALPMGWDGLADVNSMWDYIKKDGGMTLQQLQSAVKRAIAVRLKEEGMTLKDLGLREGQDWERGNDDDDGTMSPNFDTMAADYDEEGNPIDTDDAQNSFDDNEVSQEPDNSNEPVEEVSPEKKEIILTAYDNLIKRSRNTNYAPTTTEILAEIDRMQGKVPEKKKRVFPREAEPFLEEVNEEEKSDYPDPIGKKFKPKKHYPKKKQKHDTTVKLGESVQSQYPGLDQFYNENQEKIEEDWGEYLDRLRDSWEHKNFLQNCEDCFWEWIHDNYWDEAAQGYVYNYPAKVMDEGIGSSLAGLGIPMDKKAEKQAKHDIYNDPDLRKQKANYPQPDDFEVNLGDEFALSEEEKPEDGMSAEPQGDDVAQLAQDKEEQGEILQGGKGDGKSPLEFDPDQVLKGLEVEKEHTDDPLAAIEIVMDHLSEDPEYYTQKDSPEASAQAGASADVGGEEKSDVEKENPMLYPDGWKEMDGMFMNKNNPMYKKMHGIEDKETTDMLLGFKPHNVGDDIEGEEPEGAQISVNPNTDTTPESEPFKNKKEDELGESKESELKQRDPATWHQIQIAKKTMKMPGAMAGVMGGMSKEEAQRILQQRGIKMEEVQMVGSSSGTNTNNDADDELQKYEEYKKKEFDSLNDNQKEEYFGLWNKFKDQR